jgi:glutamine amidotransferase-like uncharacterized protein
MRRAAVATLLLCAALAGGCGRGAGHAEVLLFDGAGTSPNDVAAFEDLLRRRGIRYDTADSGALNSLNVDRLRDYRMLIIPGGNFEDMGNRLTPTASANVRAAVHGGLNYLGVCAGAFIAGDSPYNGINLTGVRFRFYSASSRGVRKAAMPIASPDGEVLEHYWEDGPELSGWGTPIARYPDGTPAVVQGHAGKGWVVLVGIHPEAPEDWRAGMNFTTPASADNAYAIRLIEAALQASPLPGFED